MKLDNFPRVTYISLKESHDRRHDLILQLENRGIFNHKMIECFDGRSTNYLDSPIVTGPHLSDMKSEVIATSMSHIKAIHDWYTTTEDEIGFFCEDDIKFDMVDDWNFTWNEFVSKLPTDWKIMQLALIRTVQLTQADMRVHNKKWDDWSCCAYLINRSYAKQLLDDYYVDGIFTLDVKNTRHIPIPENIVYTSNYLQTYTIPLFTENRKHKSTLIREDSYTYIEKIQNDASEFIINWWQDTGKFLTVNDLLNFDWNNSFIREFSEYNNHSAQFMIYITNDEKGEINMQTKIPVIGAPVVNSTYWIHRLIMSVDYPVENFVIINNNGRGELDAELDRLTKIKHKFIDNIKVVHMPANVGCAGAWNLIIKCYMMAPYWIIANDDVAFGPGLLKEMVDALNSDQHIGMIHPNPGDFGIGAWDLFLIRENVVRIFGLFDENTYPAYCEDADYIMRMTHRPIRKIVGLNGKYLHGDADSSMYYESGSQTQKNEDGLKEKLDFANELNIEYLTNKWGPGWRKLSPNAQPFEGEQMPISITTWDIDFVRRKHLGF